jgi:uncharacterized protein (DUF1501 family)
MAILRTRPDRREVLAGLAAASSLTVAGRVWAAPAADMRLLVVFLRGAYDAANILIPTSSSFYYESRPKIAVPRPGAGADAAIALTSDWGLHPALKEPLMPLWEKKQLAFVPFAGTDDLTRSHFETQDAIELGQPVNGSRNYNSGFMARLVSVLARTKPIAYTDQLPLVFRGGTTSIPNIGISSVGKPGVDDRQARLIASMYANDPLKQTVEEGFRVRDDVYREVSQGEMADRGAVSPKGFELSARRIGRPMWAKAAPPAIWRAVSANLDGRLRALPRKSVRPGTTPSWW